MTTTSPAVCYHPDPEINREIIADSIEAEAFDLAAGYPPRRWRCICGTEHSRGHVAGAIGVHRCLTCGYTGTEGVMFVDEGRPASNCDYCHNPITGTPVVDPDDLMGREFCSDGCLTTASEASHGAFAARERD